MAKQNPTLARAVEHHRAGRFAEAVALYRTASRFGHPAPDTCRMLADALWNTGQIDAALESLRQAVRLGPSDRAALSALAGALVSLGRHAEAVQVRRSTVARNPTGPGAVIARLDLASQLLAAHRTHEALLAVESALELDPVCVPALAERVRLLDRLGNAPEASGAAALLRAAAPQHPMSAIMLARAASQSGNPSEAAAILRAAVDSCPPDGRALLHLERSLVLDKLGDYAGAFGAAEAAHACRGGAVAPTASDPHLVAMERYLKETSAADIAKWPPADEASATDSPIFVVGFPRSGTTLVEQMLSAHARLAVTDEAPLLQGVREEMFARFLPTGRFPADLFAFTTEQVARGAELYRQRASELLGGRAGRIVDKNPLNIPDLVTARLLFPRSPVVFVQRDPRDACLSCYLQGFSRGVRALRSLDGVCAFFDAAQRLREHYAATLGQRVLELRYEDLVADPEATARRLIDFVGEPWDGAVLRYFDAPHARYITTPSYRDVRSPVHARAIGRWRNYRAELAPVLPTLTAWATRLGYPED